jgi:hypothetical protein
MPEQQSWPPAQTWPFGTQPPHVPARHCPVQHSPGLSHPNPFGRHFGWQTPPTQFALQHCVETMHAKPSLTHSSTQTFPAHVSEQHWSGDEHVLPLGTQPPRQRPSGPHAPEQHPADVLQGSPSGAQVPG